VSGRTATFRPRPPRSGLPILLGAAGGMVLGLALTDGGEALLFAAFGGLAAWITLSARHAAGLRAVAGEEGLRVWQGRAERLLARWDELRLGFGFAAGAGGSVQRYAIVADGRGRSFAFADLAGQGSCQPVAGADGQPVEVVDLPEAPLLLGLVVQRCPAWQVLPPELSLAPAPPPSGAEAALPKDLPLPGLPEGRAGERSAPRERGAGVGLLALVVKLGGKLLGAVGKVGTTAVKAAKATNLGWAAASAATYSFLFSWKFALALMLQLFVHEYGHVHAMRRTGMKVRGMYFIPLLGAMAVTEDQFSSRRQQAYVALNGPLWGSLLALLPVGLWLATGDPSFAAVAAWWGLINLFNLLPIAPLDGGRVMQAFAFSYSSGLGLAVSVLGLFGAVALGTQLGFSLIWILAALGAMELVAEAQAWAGARALRLLPEPARFGPAHWVYLRAVLGPPPGHPSEPHFLRGLQRAERAGRAEPLTSRQLLLWGLAYAGLALGLVLLVWAMRHVPGADLAAGVLE